MNKKSGCLYVMTGPEGVKVGFSRQPDKRSRQVGPGVNVAYATEFKVNGERIERGAHRLLRLAGKHVRAEWFSATVAEAKAAIERAERIDAGLELALDCRPKRKTQNKDVMTFRLPPDVLDTLTRLAREDNRSRSNYINLLLWQYVAEREAASSV